LKIIPWINLSVVEYREGLERLINPFEPSGLFYI